MSFCTSCGKGLSADANFCSNCGTAVGTTATPNRKAIYEGVLHKCPQCGETLNAFATNCPSCGYELRGIRQSGCVNDLAQRLSEATSTKQKHELISNFYIPNTREDIYEFFILAYSNISAGDEAMMHGWRNWSRHISRRNWHLAIAENMIKLPSHTTKSVKNMRIINLQEPQYLINR